MDFFSWAGGYASAESGGLSVGGLSGFRAVNHDPCVPVRPPPQITPQSKAPVLQGDVRPDGKPFDVGIGVHRLTLEAALYALYDSGGICIDMATEKMPKISSSTLSLLAPSLGALTGGVELPIRLSVRPRHPPTVVLGKGTYHQDTQGNVVIDDPLLKILAKELYIDIYLQLDERFVRLLSIVGDLEIPLLLVPETDGALQPVIGDMSQAMGNIQIKNSELLAEDPDDLAKLFPVLIGLALGAVGSDVKPIDLPDVEGLKLVLDEGSIASIDGNQALGIFAVFGPQQLEVSSSSSSR